jgi:hypothetical protein
VGISTVEISDPTIDAETLESAKSLGIPGSVVVPTLRVFIKALHFVGFNTTTFFYCAKGRLVYLSRHDNL